MLTEEGRPTVFRVAYIPSAAPVTPNRAELPPVTRYNLSAPVPFTEAELRRLAPVARKSGVSSSFREIRCPAAHNAVGLAGESPAVGIDCLST